MLVPLRGVSAIDREGQPFWWPEADAALFQSLRNWIGPQVKLIELDLHINDPEFARVAAETLLAMIVPACRLAAGGGGALPKKSEIRISKSETNPKSE